MQYSDFSSNLNWKDDTGFPRTCNELKINLSLRISLSFVCFVLLGVFLFCFFAGANVAS